VTGLFHTESDGKWTVALRANGRLREGLTLDLVNDDGQKTPWSLQLEQKIDALWIGTPQINGQARTDTSALSILESVGHVPLPPYILHARRTAGEPVDIPDDTESYQTVFADQLHTGSIAAPTAGLHFTPELLNRLDRSGISRSCVTLHVGAGTFFPVETQYVEQHPIHSEWIEVSSNTLKAVEHAHTGGHRIIAVGTTSARALESIPHPLSDALRTSGFTGSTDLLITPGFSFRWIDGLLTNFHLPRSTLLALVSALFPGGPTRIREIYRHAIAQQYRFYSYGDAMLILP